MHTAPSSKATFVTFLRISLVLAGLCLACSGVARGQEPAVTPQPQPQPTAEESVPAREETETTAEEPDPGRDETEKTAEEPPEQSPEEPPPSPPVRLPSPCRVPPPPDEELLDQYRREIFETICEAAADFDGFFGSRRFDEEARRTHGRAGLRVVWDEHDHLELDGRLRVNVDFPNLDHRVNAFLGREEKDDFLAGSENALDFLPTFFGREGGEEWLVGLGYRPVKGDRSALDFDAGIDVDSSIDPFVRGRYRHYWLIGEDNLLRARQTVYWTDRKGVGYGTRVDFEHPFGSKTLGRLSGNLVFDDETDGADWNSGITLFHGFSPDHAIAWFIGIDGETGREVPIEDYGTRVTYRQRMLREWFFGEIITGVTWPRDNRQEQRERAYHIGFGFEIQFSGADLGIGRSRP